MSNGSKSDLHIHFHQPVGAGASIHVHVPSVGGISAQLARLREELLSRQALTTDLSDAISLLMTKVQAVDDAVPDKPQINVTQPVDPADVKPNPSPVA